MCGYLQHISRLFAPLGHVLRLGQQVVEEARLVELADQLALEAVLNVVDQEVHHRLGHAAAEGGREKEDGHGDREDERSLVLEPAG